MTTIATNGRKTSSEARKTLRILRKEFPRCFNSKRRRPLKIGITDDAARILAPLITRDEVHAAVAHYANSATYLRRLRAGRPRIDLDGNPVGVVTERQAKNAQWHWLQRVWRAGQ
jgi:ProP effector